MSQLSDLLAGRNQNVPLDLAALDLARIEFPDLAAEHYRSMLDSHAVELAERLGEERRGRHYVEAANQYLFEELGFRGNEKDYYNPHNSCLNEVLTSRTGIPITLSIVYMEIARRLAKPVYGIGLPGHFIVQYNDGAFSAFIDVFHGGELLSMGACHELAKKISGRDVSGDPSVLLPVSHRQILIRMLNNLRAIYFRNRSFRKAREVLDLLLEALPDAAEEYKQRAVAHLQLREFRAAKQDFETYLRLSPDAADRKDIERRIGNARRWIAQLN